MGPPLRSWQKPIRVFRNGLPCCAEMMTQVHEKAPKWTFGGKAKDIEEKDHGPGPGGVRGPGPGIGYSFPQSMGGGRTSSAPPGPNHMPNMKPSTPQYSFGTTARPSPFAPQDGPGPGNVRSRSAGPKYSMPGRRPTSGKKGKDTPGPGAYAVRRPRTACGPRWGNEKAPRESEPNGCGPNYFPRDAQNGPAYTHGVLRPEKGDNLSRPLGPQWWYFGYDDFGHSDCTNCPDEWKEIANRKMFEQSTAQKAASAESAKRSTGSIRPSSAPGGRARRSSSQGDLRRRVQ